ncbi:hypothetical protein FRB98_000860 [Tulasnella sp. 332]|nr:hypothetical protein FRB98_000860 [Tulasnella sp. 332]
MVICFFCYLAFFVSYSLSAAIVSHDRTVKLDNGTFIGLFDKELNTIKFLGIPFAKPPTGNLRFRRPVSPDPYTGSRPAIKYGLACPQQPATFPSSHPEVRSWFTKKLALEWARNIPDGEDCGFQFGSTAMKLFDGGKIVSRSLETKQPVIVITLNYRGSLFGFLGGKEIKAAQEGNLGLQDQRLALRWIQRYVSNFGGDPKKVTLWGESAGAISTSLQMVTNGGDTEGLFRAAFMQSGAAIPASDIDSKAPQQEYNVLVDQVGCGSSKETLQCLREAPYEKLRAFMLSSAGLFEYTSLALAWVPRIDGNFLKEAPMKSVKDTRVARIPFVSGNTLDEGTVFSLSTLNITTDKQFRNWFQATYLPVATDDEMHNLAVLYPENLELGSPFESGLRHALSPQYKRISAVQGDLSFQAPRRHFIQSLAGKQKAWSFLYARGAEIPVLGSLHGADLLDVWGKGELRDYLINFANHLDPNVGHSVFRWPQYTLDKPTMLRLKDNPLHRLDFVSDSFRQKGMQFLIDFSLRFH